MWLFHEGVFTEDMIEDNVGFVYEITNKTNGKWYIGKKNFTKAKRYQKKGKKRSKRVSSDWETYTGSNDELNTDIANGHKIEKRILYLCKSKGWMTYHETRLIFHHEALTDPKSYNKWVMCRIRSDHLK